MQFNLILIYYCVFITMYLSFMFMSSFAFVLRRTRRGTFVDIPRRYAEQIG